MGVDMHFAIEDARRVDHARLWKAMKRIAKLVKLPMASEHRDGPSPSRQDHLEAIVKAVQDLVDTRRDGYSTTAFKS